MLRFVMRRDAGSVGLADILVIVLIADAAQNGMTGEYKSVAEGFVVVGTIFGWNYFTDWMSYRYSCFARFAEPRAVVLIRHGTVLWNNLRREMITKEELESQLRRNSAQNIAEVKHATLEPDGSISIVRYSNEEQETRKKASNARR
jgi:uncharacterized membrane protein YcaP (DUF421 family)